MNRLPRHRQPRRLRVGDRVKQTTEDRATGVIERISRHGVLVAVTPGDGEPIPVDPETRLVDYAELVKVKS